MSTGRASSLTEAGPRLEVLDERPAGWIGEGVEHRVDRCRMVKHLLKYYTSMSLRPATGLNDNCIATREKADDQKHQRPDALAGADRALPRRR